MKNTPSPLRNDCEVAILKNPGITMAGVSLVVGEKVAHIDHLVRRLVDNGTVLTFQADGQGMARS